MLCQRRHLLPPFIVEADNAEARYVCCKDVRTGAKRRLRPPRKLPTTVQSPITIANPSAACQQSAMPECAFIRSGVRYACGVVARPR